MSDSLDAMYQVLNDIRRTINDCTAGRVSDEVIKKRYRRLANAYRTLEQSLLNTNPAGFLKGLLYHHNASNYTRLTALFKQDSPGDPIVPVIQTGDRILLSAMPELITSRAEALPRDRIIKTDLGLRDQSKFQLVLKKFIREESVYIAVAVTSSAYFSNTAFDHLTALLMILFCDERSEIDSRSINVTGHIAEGLYRYIDHLLPGAVQLDYYIVQKYELSFYSLSSSESLMLSVYMRESIEAHYGGTMKIIPIHLFTFLAIGAVENGRRPPITDVKYRGTNILFSVERFTADSRESVRHILGRLVPSITGFRQAE